MTDVLIIGDTFRSPELRHEVPLGVPDPFVYLERDGVRHVYVGSMEVPRIRGIARDIVVHPLEEIGIDELYAQGLGWLEVRHEWAARAAAHAGLTHAAVPNTFPAGYLDRLRRDGVELTVDQAVFDERRRVKAGAELEGIRRAQRAAEAGLAAGVSLLQQAENGDGVLWLDGEPLTVERIKAAMRRVFAEHGCTAEDFVVAPGPQGAAGHEMGHGPIKFGDPVVFDLWPRDDASSCFADMTRTIVAGPVSDQVREWHTLTRAALDCGDRAHPGRRGLPVGLRCGLRGLRGRGVSDPAHEDGGRGARPGVLPRPRARRRPRGARRPVHGLAARRPARRRRRRHGRAGLLRPGDRWRPARRPRARDRRRLRGADPVPVRPRGRRPA